MISPAVASLADAALLLPASALLVIGLLLLGRWSLALAFAISLGLAGLGTVAAKLLFHACGPALSGPRVVSPSGHASFAIFFYGAVAILFGSGRPVAVRWALGVSTALLVAAVGVSRVRTGAHTPAEVALGLGMGAAALALFAVLQARAGQPRLPWMPVAAAFGVALLLLGGRHFSLEPRIGALARQLSDRLDVCAPAERIRSSRFDTVRPER